MNSVPSDLPLGLSSTTWYVIGGVVAVIVLIFVYYMFFAEEKAEAKAEKMSDSDKAMVRRMYDLNRSMDPRRSMAAVQREGMVDPVLVAAAMRS